MSVQIDDSRIISGDMTEVADTLIRLRAAHIDLLERYNRLVAGYGPKCSVYRASGLTLSNATWELVPWDATYYDTAGFHDDTTNPSRIIAPIDGRYEVTCNILHTNNANGALRLLQVRKNAAGASGSGTEEMRDYRAPITGNRSTNNACVFFTNLYEGDYLEAFGYQNSGGDLNLNVGGTNNVFTMTRVGDFEA